MSSLKDWDTPFGPSEVINDMLTNDKIPSPKLLENIGWDNFRRGAAKDIFCAMMMSGIYDTWRIMAENAITATDELIKQLREGKK